jgi:hypothetical protein
MSTIYEQHDAAFAQVSAWVVLNQTGERVATIAIKSPRDGAGRLQAFVHWIGVPMVRGQASGGGYDKATAAISDAASRMISGEHAHLTAWQPFAQVLMIAQTGWTRVLEDAGFRVLQAV